jgi:hypothetical protein
MFTPPSNGHNCIPPICVVSSDNVRRGLLMQFQSRPLGLRMRSSSPLEGVAAVRFFENLLHPCSEIVLA